ncbi:MAG: hypothetical protein BZ137_02335 [Methanosphaera sp. rholeuAM130]|nr:hypothetical protein [Methanosphaera sp.]RAP54403.1 MAG: hypothetical protein BZ137_02335 [Methanosphaera sp. rholeuAM130]
MKSKILSILLIICSIALIAGFFIFTPTYIQTNGDVKHFSDSDMSFDIPNTWTVYEYDDATKTPFLSSSPASIIVNPASQSTYSYNDGNLTEITENGALNTSATSATDVAIVTCEISKMDSLPEGVTLDNAYQSDSIYGIMESSGKFNLDSATVIQVDGKDARQFVYTVSYTKYKDTWVESNGHYYRILCQAPNTFFDEAESVFDTIVNTMKLK